MTSLETILEQVRRDLKQKHEIRETAHTQMQKATRLSKQAILFTHQKKTTQANKAISEAKELISDLHKTAETYPDMIYGGMFSAALQEYSEARIFMNLIRKSTFINPQEIDVDSTDYVLGLADVIGEYRRLALDALREDNIKESEKCLETMDKIYVELLAMDETYMLVPGLRRKSDIARRIIETTRGDITQEVRRSMLEKYLKRFEKALKRPE
jgi:translin